MPHHAYGTSKDRIVGSAGHDILVAGEIDSALTMDELRAILADWAADKDPDDGTGDDILDETVVIDGQFDRLTGSSGSDWFIISTGDKVTDFKTNKVQQDLITIV